MDLHVPTHSFPTRRSSDLADRRGDLLGFRAALLRGMRDRAGDALGIVAFAAREKQRFRHARSHMTRRDDVDTDRSEEHTSELQSLMRISYAVFCWKNNRDNEPENEKHRHHL